MSTRFMCDYAKRVSACKKCKLQLAKGVMRLAKVTPNPFVQNEDGRPPPDMKSYFHANCLFETFFKARATTKVIEEAGDVEGWSELTAEDKDEVSKLIDELVKFREEKAGGKTPRKTPAKTAAAAAKEVAETSTPKTEVKKRSEKKSTENERKSSEKEKSSEREKKVEKEKKTEKKKGSTEINEDSKYNSFNKFCKLCEVIASVSKYTDKAACVNMFIKKENFDGDVLTLVRLLLPVADQRVYNIKEKQILHHFSQLYDLDHDDLMNEYKQDGDVSVTMRRVMEKKNLCRSGKSDWSIQKVDRWLTKLTEFTKDEEQMNHLKFAAKRLPGLELMYLLRLIKKDLRFNAGVKHVLDGLHSSAYEAFQNCRDLEEIVQRCATGNFENSSKNIEVGIRLGTPVLPMLAEPCKSTEQAMRRCPNGIISEIKYDGERVQVHKSGDNFSFFSRSLKPVQAHKTAQLEKFIPQAFVDGSDLILDAEVLMVDTATGKPLPFGTLGIHKREQFKNAAVCLYVFDILKYNERDLLHLTISERKKILEKHMVEVPNHIVFSNYEIIKHGDHDKLKTMIWKAIDEGLEGLVLKDTQGIYEPGKRHWLKVKKDYLEEGKMADTADLIVLGAYFGTGAKGGTMSVFLMGVYDKSTDSYRTVTKCGNGHTDEQLERINNQLKGEMSRINRDYESLPSWLRCSRSLAPDFVIKDPKKAPIWEITGAEFSKSENHTAGGVSIRFPRVTRIRGDKDWQSATSLDELKRLFDLSKEKSEVDRSVDDEIPLYAKNKTTNEKEDEREQKFEVPSPTEVVLENSPKSAENSQTSAPKQKAEIGGEEEGDTETPRAKKKRRRLVCDSDDEESEGSSTKKRKSEERENGDICPPGMTPCQYGSSCYRKNPDHKKNFWHPKKQ